MDKFRFRSIKNFCMCVLTIIFIQVISVPKAHAIPQKATALLTMCAYGTVGGALLGVASLAFGAKPIAVAQGASIGLWAGLAFGSFVILSHHYDFSKADDPKEDPYYDGPEYEGGSSPYEGAGAVEVDTYGGGELHNSFDWSHIASKKIGKSLDFTLDNGRVSMPIYINLINLSF
ncbi:MAG: hypothetical protein HOE90_17365 [Bacteriovoracaceae bacterium]|nr:hypothetical protein [Bacteriovoracaceae bacterium]